MGNQVTTWKVLSIAAVVLLVVNTVLGIFNHSAQMAIGQRQAYIVQTQQVARVSQQAATVIGTAAEQDRNDPLRAVLTKNGYTLRPSPVVSPVAMPVAVPTPAPASPPPAAALPPAAPRAAP